MRRTFAFLVIPAIILCAPSRTSAADEKDTVYKGKTFAQWIHDLINPWWQRDREREARKALGPRGPYAKVAVPALINALKDRKPPWDDEVENTLADYGPEAIPALIKALKRPELKLRVGVISALSRFKAEAKDTVPILIEELKNPDPDIRVAAASALGHIGSEAAASALIRALYDSCHRVGEAADDALKTIPLSEPNRLAKNETAYQDKTFPRWMDDLTNPSCHHGESEARKALGPGGPYGKVAVPALINALNDRKPPWDQDHEVENTLADFGPEVIPALIKALKRPEPKIRVGTIIALGLLGSKAQETVPILIEQLQDPDPDIREATADALKTIAKESKSAKRTLIAALNHKKHSMRLAVANILLRVDPNGGPQEVGDELFKEDLKIMLPRWIEALNDGSHESRQREASYVLGRHGPYAKVAIPALIDAFKQPRTGTSLEETLGDYGLHVVPVLLQALKRPEPKIKVGAAGTLGYLKARESLPALIEAIKDPSKDVRVAALLAIDSIGPYAESAAPALGLALSDPSEDVQFAAARALNRLGPHSKPAKEALVAALRRQSVREAAARPQEPPLWMMIIWEIRVFDPETAVQDLVKAIKTGSEWDRIQAAQTIGVLGALREPGATTKEVVHALIEALHHPSYDVQASVAGVLGQLGATAKEAVPALIEAARDKKSDKVPWIGTGAAIAETVRDAATRALGRIGLDAKTAVPFLIEALRILQYSYRKLVVVQSLGQIGPEARSAIPALVAIAKDHSEGFELPEAAAKAAAKIDPAEAARLDIESVWSGLKLGPIPNLKLRPRPPATPEQKKHIKELIAMLADYSESGELEPTGFWSVPGGAQVQTNQGIKASNALKDLVAIGPEAIPLLLDALDDSTPTRLKAHVPFFGGDNVV
jgi:HEAT repeat protein